MRRLPLSSYAGAAQAARHTRSVLFTRPTICKTHASASCNGHRRAAPTLRAFPSCRRFLISGAISSGRIGASGAGGTTCAKHVGSEFRGYATVCKWGRLTELGEDLARLVGTNAWAIVSGHAAFGAELAHIVIEDGGVVTGERGATFDANKAATPVV